MRIAEIIQTAIHKLEVGGGARFFRVALLVLAVLMLALLYDVRAYRNLSTPEGMDAAQLARNISEGKGFTTLFIRPLSLYLVQRHNQAKLVGEPVSTNHLDLAEINRPHPDLENAPVYPIVLAGLMKVFPFHFPVNLDSPFWSDSGRFSRYEPDFLIAIFNEILLLVIVVLTFFLARKLFDATVAWLAALLVIGCELLWRFSVSGLSTLLLLVIFLGLTWSILKIEESAREPQQRPGRLLSLALTIGALVGIGALTRYAFGWVIIPVVIFLALFSGQRRVVNAMAALGVFFVFLTPWVLRNYFISGTPFGTAGFAVVENSFVFPNFQLERSIHPDLTHALWLRPYIFELVTNAHGILTDELPKFGGSWAGALFLASLLIGFRGLPVRRMRYFLLMCLGTFIIVQSLGQTHFADESPEINSGNLLVLLVPLVFIYGVSFFSILLDQMSLPAVQLRYIIMGAFVTLSCLPMIFALLPPKANPVVYPPYYPPEIQQVSGWMKPNELMMSDVPWAVAWYGDRQCAWLTLNAQSDFFAINDNIKPVQALYLTPETMNARFLSDWIRPHDYSWGSFILQAVTEKQIPPGFPLRQAPSGFLPERLFLTDWPRWKLAAQ